VTNTRGPALVYDGVFELIQTQRSPELSEARRGRINKLTAFMIYHGIRPYRIAKETGVSRESLYCFLHNKRDIMLATWERLQEYMEGYKPPRR
jgi:AcrR family transcriptional regulator